MTKLVTMNCLSELISGCIYLHLQETYWRTFPLQRGSGVSKRKTACGRKESVRDLEHAITIEIYDETPSLWPPW